MDSLVTVGAGHPFGSDGNGPGRSFVTTPLQQLFAALYRQRYPALGVILAALVLGVLATLFLPKKYTSVASVVLEQQAPQIIAVPDLDPQRNAQDAERFLQTQIDLVHSRTLAIAVADQLKASGDPKILDALSVRESDPAVRAENVVAALMDGVRVELGLNTRLARITYTSRDPNVSAKVANAYARQLVSSNLTSKTGTSSRAADYLKRQLADAKTRLEDSERGMLGFARAAGLTDADLSRPANGQASGSLSSLLVGHLSQSLADATARRIVSEQEWQQLKGVSPMALPQVQQNRAVQDMLVQRAAIGATKAEENERYTSEYPTESNAKLNSLSGQINWIAANVKQSYFNNYLSTMRQEQEIRRSINGLRSAVMAERETGIGYNSLQREAETNKAFYDGLLQRYKEVVAAAGAPSINITVMDQAAPSLVPTSPNLVSNMALALILGLIAAIGIVIIRERTHSVIRSTFDLGAVYNLDFIGIVPATSKGKRVEDALDNPSSPQSEAYNSVAVSVLKMDSGKLPRTLLITSSIAGEGKTTTALGLAFSLTRLGKRVLLIDGDLRHTALGSNLGEPEGPGFAEALAGTTTPQSVIRNMAKLGFDVICAGSARDNPVGLLAHHNVAPVLEQLISKYDVIIIDGPPIMGIADAVVLSDSIDAVVVAAEANRIQSNQLGLALSRLSGTVPIGGVLTKFDARAAGVEYGNEQYFTYA